MAKYINRDVLLEGLIASEKMLEIPDYHYGVIYAAIKQLPTADVVEVVRCKDCKYRDTIPDFCNVLLDGCRWASEESPDDDDYCSFGVRREEG